MAEDLNGEEGDTGESAPYVVEPIARASWPRVDLDSDLETRAQAVVEDAVAGVPPQLELASLLLRSITGDLVGDGLDKQITQEIRRLKIKPSARTHAWCSVVAALCKTIDEAEEHATDFTEAVINNALVETCRACSVIVAPYPQNRPHRVHNQFMQFIIEMMARRAARAIVAAVSAGLQVETVKLTLRLAGMLCCPDPDQHPAVFKYCIYPLVMPVINDALSGVVREILRSYIASWSGERPAGTRGNVQNYWDDDPDPQRQA